jgi:hypothetical protein
MPQVESYFVSKGLLLPLFHKFYWIGYSSDSTKWPVFKPADGTVLPLTDPKAYNHFGLMRFTNTSLPARAEPNNYFGAPGGGPLPLALPLLVLLPLLLLLERGCCCRRREPSSAQPCRAVLRATAHGPMPQPQPQHPCCCCSRLRVLRSRKRQPDVRGRLGLGGQHLRRPVQRAVHGAE